MPIYEFCCEGCGPFSVHRSISQSGEPATCPECGGLARKVFPLIHLRAMRPAVRNAWARNERSAHQPHVCGAGCQHGLTTTKAKRPGDKPASAKYQYSKKTASRPWMLGH